MPRRRGPDPPRTRPRCRPWPCVINSRITLVSPWRLTPSTMPSSTHSMIAYYIFFDRDGSTLCSPSVTLLLGEFEPHCAVAFRVVGPSFPHLDVEKKMHRLFDRHGDFRARRSPDRLERLAAFAEDDFALALALYIECLLNAHRAILELFPDLGF